MDRSYMVDANDMYSIKNVQDKPQEVSDAQVSKPIFKASELAPSVIESPQHGRAAQVVTAAIRRGASRVELATSMGGQGPPAGPESYSHEARQDLREIAKATGTMIQSVHSPVNIGNLSGLSQNGFSDAQRNESLNEVKNSINFAADVARGGAVVVHTGEFQRSIANANWNKDRSGEKIFEAFPGEEEQAPMTLVDDRTGQMIQGVTRSQVVYEPVFKTADFTGWAKDNEGKDFYVEKGKTWVDREGKPIKLDPDKPENLLERVPLINEKTGDFEVRRKTFREYEKEADDYNKEHNTNVTPEEMFYWSQMDNNIMSTKGTVLYHSRHYNSVKNQLEDIDRRIEIQKTREANATPDMLEVMKVRDPNTGKEILESEKLEKDKEEAQKEFRYIQESAASAEAKVHDLIESRRHVKSAEKYAKERSWYSFAEAGLYAREQSKRGKYVERDLFVAPENIFPEMGYGSHPDELIDLVQGSRKKMIDMLTKPFMPDPSGRTIHDPEEAKELSKKTGKKLNVGDEKIIENRYYAGMSRQEAEKEAEKHIRATFDTQHLGMWWKHFKPKAHETEEERKKRFDDWYIEQVKKMEKSGIIGHVHALDAMGASHHHLPVGQGNLPVVKAVEHLREKGKNISFTLEGHEEGPDRQLFESWKAFGVSPIGASPYNSRPVPFSAVHQGYFGRGGGTNYVQGQYVPSNDWNLWSQVGFE